MYSKIILVGNLGADPEKKEISGGKVMAKLRLATKAATKEGETSWCARLWTLWLTVSKAWASAKSALSRPIQMARKSPFEFQAVAGRPGLCGLACRSAVRQPGASGTGRTGAALSEPGLHAVSV